MKKRVIGILMAVFALSFSIALFACNTDNNVEETKQCMVTYIASDGGYLIINYLGERHKEASFTVDRGASTEATIQACAKNNYAFAGWSDGERSPIRSEKDVQSDLTLTAYFRLKAQEEKKAKFLLNYKIGYMSNIYITFSENSFQKQDLPVPKKEHYDFKGWYIGDKQVADENGKIVVGEELFSFQEREIQARWKAKEQFVHKTLLVYVTRVKAEVLNGDLSEKISVDYTMSDDERALCRLTTKKLKERMDNALDGLVDFHIDEYFTEETIDESGLKIYRHVSIGSSGGYVHYVNIKKIPEVKDMLGNYDTVLAVYSFNDRSPFPLTDQVIGVATEDEGTVMFDKIMNIIEECGLSVSAATNILANSSDTFQEYITYKLGELEDYFYNIYLDAFMHEIAHEIDCKLGQVKYHYALDYSKARNHLDTFYYYRNESLLNGEICGFPYEYWRGDKIVSVKYSFTDGGNVKTSQSWVRRSKNYVSVNYLSGYKPITAQAIPDEGYKFVGWSDGVMTAVRTDMFYEDYEVTALFERI